MPRRVAVVYNQPLSSRYDERGEGKAVAGVLGAVTAVKKALIELGDTVIDVPLSLPVSQVINILRSLDADVVFNLFEGFCGNPETEVLVPEILSQLRVPYTGCSGPVLKLALDKAGVNEVLKNAGIPTPDFQVLALQNMDRFNLSFPCMVKPRNEDASHGLSESSVVNSFDMLRRQVKNVSDSFGGSALVEEFLAGREFNATVLGNDKIYVLPVSEIVYSLPREVPRILTFAAKWDVDSPYYKGTQAVCPAEIEKHEHHLITETAIAAFRLLGCRGYARIDMRFNDAGQLNVIEVNPNPDISPDAGAARQALAAGMTYTQFVEKIIQLSLEKEYNAGKNPSHGEKRQTIPGGHFKGYTRVQTV